MGERKLKVAITSGGTICQLDDVRYLGNFSTGNTGARIAEAFLRQGHIVYYLHQLKAERPFRRNLQLDPLCPLTREIERVSQVYQEFQHYCGKLYESPFVTFDDYYQLVRQTLQSQPIDAVILAAAVSDYGPVAQTGKIRSDLDQITLKMVRYPKVISLVKQWRPQVFQVGFKLLSRVSLNELIAVAHEHGVRNRSDLTVANALLDGEFNRRVVAIISPEREVTSVSPDKLPAALTKLIGEKFSQRSREL